MKFFTPDLITRASAVDDAIADAAQEEWEERRSKYQEHLRAIRPQLPRPVHTFLGRFCLHDAQLKWIAERADERRVVMALQLDTPPGESLQLVYDLVGEPQTVRHPFLAEPVRPPQWLYDEIDAEESDHGTVCTHSILFTDGNEVILKFKKLHLKSWKTSQLVGGTGLEHVGMTERAD
jgi:hypothetical protein